MADMSMKLENIIKSLRYCCGDLDVTRVCHKCPYHMPEDADRMCIDELMSEAANAIEELSGFVQEAERDRDEYKERLDKTNDAIEFLQTYKTCFDNIVSMGGWWMVGQDKNLYRMDVPMNWPPKGTKTVELFPLPEPPEEGE